MKKRAPFSPTEGPGGNDRSAGGQYVAADRFCQKPGAGRLQLRDGHPSSISKIFDTGIAGVRTRY
ncbi:hypothetical protein CLJ1_3823 [Pseudomonas paraeruginosa]|nr:hypothetical protein CLJ1_3823 [Pseudomonas aeruginosa]